jgi:hypothetical protein
VSDIAIGVINICDREELIPVSLRLVAQTPLYQSLIESSLENRLFPNWLWWKLLLSGLDHNKYGKIGIFKVNIHYPLLAGGFVLSYLLSCTTVALYGTPRKPSRKKK